MIKSEHSYTHRVSFSETDMAGIVHFSKFFIIVEDAEHDFFRSVGLSITDRYGSKPTGWPRVHSSCDFISPIHYNELISVQLIVAEMRSSAISYHFTLNKENGEVAARGTIITAFVQFDEASSRMKARIIPDAVRAKIGPKAA